MYNRSESKSLKGFVFDIPFIGYFLRSLNYSFRQPKYQDKINKKFEQLDQKISILNRTVDESLGLFADNHLLDAFYRGFEDRFRGSEDEVIKKLGVYLKYFKNSKVNFNDYPVIDLGCGRGEFLSLMKSSNVNAIGVDLNKDMLKSAKDKGLRVYQENVIDYMTKAKPSSIGAVTGFHIVEHIPFQVLLKLFSSIHSSLVKDGFLIFETPNPENIIVGSTNFYYDPSHLKPLPPHLLAYVFEMSGFKDIEIRRLNPQTKKNNTVLPDDLFNKLYVGPDYAVIGFK